MISTLELERFQGFEFPQSVRVAPLTLLFGPNSGGKSSILRALRFLGQWSAEQQKFPFSGPLVNLGSFEAAVFSGDPRSRFQLSVARTFSKGNHHLFSLIPQIARRNVEKDRSRVDFRFDTRKFVVNYEFDAKGDGLPKQIEMRHEFKFRFPHYSRDGGFFIDKKTGKPIEFDLAPFENESHDVSLLFKRGNNAGEHTFELKAWGGPGLDAVWVLSTADPRTQSLPETITFPWHECEHLEFKLEDPLPTVSGSPQGYSPEYLLLGQYLTNCVREIQVAPKIRYVGPLRQIARGFETPSPDTQLAADGSNIARFLASLEPSEFKALNTWLGLLTEDRYEVQVVSQDVGKGGMDSDGFRLTGETLSAIFLRDHHTKTTVSLQNAGVGISQVMPILAQMAAWGSRRSRRESLRNVRRPEMLLVEQPELHLHPRMQADLASVLVESIMSSRSGERGGKQAVIETHSEAMLLRVQKLIREGEITPEDVSVIYVDKFPGGGNLAQELRLDSTGLFMDSWPASFSELRWGEEQFG